MIAYDLWLTLGKIGAGLVNCLEFTYQFSFHKRLQSNGPGAAPNWPKSRNLQ